MKTEQMTRKTGKIDIFSVQKEMRKKFSMQKKIDRFRSKLRF